MAKQIDESKVLPGTKGPFHVVDEGKEGGYYGVWFKRKDGLWSHFVSGQTKGNAETIADAFNERPFLGTMNKYAKRLVLK